MTFEVVNPNQIKIGDTIQVLTNGRVRHEAAVVRDIQPCGSGPDIFLQDYDGLICSGAPNYTFHRILTPAAGDWRPVSDSEIQVGDLIRATFSATQVDEGTVTEVRASVIRIRITGSQSVISAGRLIRTFERWTGIDNPPTPVTDMVPLSTLAVGDQFIGTPTGLTGCLHAQVTDAADRGPVRAATLAVLEATSNGRGHDLSRGTNDPYLYLADQLVTRVQPSTPVVPMPPTWHPLPFSSIQVGDLIRATYGSNQHEGTVTSISGARLSYRSSDNSTRSATALRSFEVSNRDPGPLPATQSLADRYPSIHHLKAALFDLARENQKSGAWCSDVHEWVQELGIATNLYDDGGILDQDEQVQALVTKLQAETAGGRGISQESIDRAYQSLGLPTPIQSRMVTITVQIPASIPLDQITRYMEQAASGVAVESVTE